MFSAGKAQGKEWHSVFASYVNGPTVIIDESKSTSRGQSPWRYPRLAIMYSVCMWLWRTKKLTEARAVAFKLGAVHDLFNSADGDTLLDLIDDHLGAYEGIAPPFNPTFNYVVYTQKNLFEKTQSIFILSTVVVDSSAGSA